jgi:hypothetical protein
MWSGQTGIPRRGFLAALGAGGLGGCLSSPNAGLIDLFLVGGQSNAEGQGTAVESPIPEPGTAFEYRSNGLYDLVDPVGGAESGSAWPAFATRYHEVTGRRIVVVEAAEDGSGQFAGSIESVMHWDEGGALRGRAVSMLDECVAYLSKRTLEPRFRGILWSQGERDGEQIAQGNMTRGQYYGAFRRMVRYFQNEVDAGPVKQYLFQTGRPANASRSKWAAVREAQVALAEALDPVEMVFDHAVEFPEEGKMQEWAHYNQRGYNEMGRLGAETVANTLF